MLAKAVATECRPTFFNISASTLVSKWRGDSEKLVRALFEVARYHGPSTIFLDEMDAILSARGGEGGQEHEASRRMKTELLMQMDGLKASSTAAEQVFVMAASNLPWDLDTAVLRRLEKRVMVPLPGVEAREAMLRQHLAGRCAPDMDFTEFAAQTEGYSGADMELLCREAAMKPVRRLMQKLQDLPPPQPATAAPRGAAGGGSRARVAAAGGGGGGGGPCSAEVAAQMLREDPVSLEDFTEAHSSTKSSSDQAVMGRYEQWQHEFGSV
jgi:katanin p60 ATPase-containing subunit A1